MAKIICPDIFFRLAIPGLFSLFSSIQQLTLNMHGMFKNLPMTGFEPRTSGNGSDRSANLARTTAQGRYFMP